MKLQIEDIAHIIYDANSTYSKALGDDTKPLWDNLEQHAIESIIQGIQYRISDDGITPEEMHHNFLEFKLNNGWVYGEEFDHDKKTHPCIMSYDDLPEEQKAKDKLFSGIVDALKHLL